MLEKQIEHKLGLMVKRRGGIALKFVSPSFAGMPDRLVLLPSMFPWRHIPCAVLSSLPCGSAPFMIVAVYLISDGHSIFRSFLNWLHHTPKNRNSRIISMVENSRKNAPFFPIGKHEAHCNFMLEYGRISASGGCL